MYFLMDLLKCASGVGSRVVSSFSLLRGGIHGVTYSSRQVFEEGSVGTIETVVVVQDDASC